MKNIILFVVSFVALLSAPTAQADNHAHLIKQLIDEMHVAEMLEEQIDTTTPIMRQMFEGVVMKVSAKSYARPSNEQIAKASEIFSIKHAAYKRNMISQLLGAYAAEHKRIYTPNETAELLVIMRTPLGQKFFVEDSKIWNRLLSAHFAAEQQQGTMQRYVVESFQEAGIAVPKQ